MATQSVIEASLPNAETLRLSFSNGKVLELTIDSLSPAIREQAMLHGLKQKLVDAAAISRNTDTGQSATVQDKFDAVSEVHARLLAGQWNKARASGEPASGGLLVRALMQMKAKTRDEIKTFLDGLSKEQVAAIRKNPKVAAVMASLKPEPKTDGIDSDDLLGELDA